MQVVFSMQIFPTVDSEILSTIIWTVFQSYITFSSFHQLFSLPSSVLFLVLCDRLSWISASFWAHINIYGVVSYHVSHVTFALIKICFLPESCTICQIPWLLQCFDFCKVSISSSGRCCSVSNYASDEFFLVTCEQMVNYMYSNLAN